MRASRSCCEVNNTVFAHPAGHDDAGNTIVFTIEWERCRDGKTRKELA